MQQVQRADGSESLTRERDSFEMNRIGGYMAPAAANQNSGSYPGGINLQFNVQGGTDTGGGILQWQNNLGYDLIVTLHVLDVTTVASAACTASFGSAASSVTVSTNMINGQDVHTATGTFGGALTAAVKVANGNWITGSKGGGASAGMIGRVTISAISSNPTVGGI